MRNFTALAQRALLILLMLVAGSAAAQQAYPNRPIRFIVPYPPGGGADPVARIVAQKLVEAWGQPVIVDNRPGGNTVIGNDAVAKAAPDGYTILLGSNTLSTLSSLLPSLPYDPLKDFDAVAAIAKSPYVLVVHPSVPASNLKELIAVAKARPGQLNYAAAGTGGMGHLGIEMLTMMTGIKLQFVPYKGSGPLISDLIAGQIQLALNNTISTIAPLIKGDRLKPIAVGSEKRLAALPQVPTFGEAGLPGYEAITWFAIVAPAGTPKAIIDKISNQTAALLAMPDTQDSLAKQGMEPFVSTRPDEVASLIRTEMAKYARIIRSANIKIEN